MYGATMERKSPEADVQSYHSDSASDREDIANIRELNGKDTSDHCGAMDLSSPKGKSNLNQ